MCRGQQCQGNVRVVEKIAKGGGQAGMIQKGHVGAEAMVAQLSRWR